MKNFLANAKSYWLSLSWKKKLVFGLPVGGLLLLWFFYLLLILGFFGPIPRSKDFRNIKDLEASKVIGIEGSEIGKLYQYQKEFTPFDELPEHLVNALIVTEDKRFYKHHGIDWKSVFRAVFKTSLLGQDAGGGSTLSQQLVKNIFGRPSKFIVLSKLKEMVGAKRLERMYSKNEIIEMYLNTIPFGENVYGIQGGSKRFFNKNPSELTVNESAVLVGLLKANTSYNPRINPERSVERRNLVLKLMHQNEFLEEAEYLSLIEEPLILDYNAQSNDNLLPHFLLRIIDESKQILEGKTKRNNEPYDVKRDGLTIYTSIHPEIQQLAEKATKTHLAKLQNEMYRDWGNRRPWGTEPEILKNAISSSARYKFLMDKKATSKEIEKAFAKTHTMYMYTPEGTAKMKMSPLDSVKFVLMQLKSAMVAIDNYDSGILAYVGSPDSKHFQYDYATSQRHAASTFKPLIFTAAIERGIKPCDYFRNEQVVYTDYDNWKPANYDNKYGGKYSMAGALAKSINVIAVDLLYKAGRTYTIDLIHKMGIKSSIDEVPSIALGAASVSLLEMVETFSNFPKGGKHQSPYFVWKIVDRTGELIYEREEIRPNQAIKAETAEIMVALLQAVVDKGTGIALRKTYKLKTDLAGKTGTSQSYSDGWFVGFSPDITAGVWVGADQPSIHFRTGKYGQGSHMALPIFALFMQGIEQNDSLKMNYTSSFPILSEQAAKKLNCADYKDKSDVEKFFDSFRGNEFSDEKLRRKNRRKQFWKGIFKF